MKVYRLYQVNDLRYEDIEEPEPIDGWGLIRVMACGICSSDIPRIFEKGTYNFPTIPGHEFSGIVEKVSRKTDESWIGKRVAVFPLIPCKRCSYCQAQKYEMCENYDYLGSRCDGGFAELVRVPMWNLMEIPESISYSEAAMLEPLAVALHAVKKSEIKSGDVVGVVGTGMIGFGIAQLAKIFNAKNIYVIGRDETKRNMAENFDGINYIAGNIELKEELQCDVVIEAVGSSMAIETAIKIVRPEGRIVLMGNPKEDVKIKQDVYWRILRKQITLCGTWNSTYEQHAASDWKDVIRMILEKKLRLNELISHSFEQEELMNGIELMRAKKESYCKVMVNWNNNSFKQE